MRYVVFDIETQNTFDDVGKNEPALLDISVMCAYDSETDTYHAVTVDELTEIWPLFENAEAIVGYNSDHFDIPILEKYYPGSLKHIKSIDLLSDIKDSLGRRLRLDGVAEATLGTKKDGHGLQAIAWWKNGEIEKLKKYCQKDVEITKDLFLYAQEHGVLKYKDGLETKEIKINTSNWTPKEDSVMTHSLPF